ncbi:hypothetical protein Q5O24_00560 [Eubacteriaceae bacterium ES3]|nr:hypothetical protein Q5O24_00560 [Eubacteriaceae bacterium ES3]
MNDDNCNNLTGAEMLDLLADLVVGTYHNDIRHELLNFIESLKEGLPKIFGEVGKRSDKDILMSEISHFKKEMCTAIEPFNNYLRIDGMLSLARSLEILIEAEYLEMFEELVNFHADIAYCRGNIQ